MLKLNENKSYEESDLVNLNTSHVKVKHQFAPYKHYLNFI